MVLHIYPADVEKTQSSLIFIYIYLSASVSLWCCISYALFKHAAHIHIVVDLI